MLFEDRINNDRTALLCGLLFNLAHSNHITEAHDRVFGQYAVLAALSLHILEPDYSLPLSEIHEDYIFVLIKV